MFNQSIKKIIFILILLSLSSCSISTENEGKTAEKSINISNNEIEIKSDGTNVKVWNEIEVKNGKMNIKVWNDWVKIEWIDNIDLKKYKKSEEVENEEIVEVLSCEDHYKELLNTHKKDFSDCNFDKNEIWVCNWENIDEWKVNLVVVFDDSWSMWAKIWNDRMIDIAKNSISKYIRQIDVNETNLWIVLYWHKWSSLAKEKEISCNWVETILSLESKDKISALNRINNLYANGWTPIDKSLQKAKQMINSYAKPQDKNIILLISDGKESCQWSPIQTAKNISDWKNKIKIDVIWFNVKWEDRSELLNISNSWGWKYFDVKNELEFEKTFNNVKTFLKTLECWANKAAQELEQWVKAINTYFLCEYKMKEEEALIFTSMDERCEDYVEDELEIRQKLLESDFENLKREWEDILDDFSDNMSDIKNKIR